MAMNGQELRAAFLEFFKERGHEVVASSPLVPRNDDTLLFTNAGMVQFKEIFLGRETRSYTTATSSQRCTRAGGKHNDLEEVGRTARHLTYFEMLGNFSFGDYFKKESVAYGWEFLTDVVGLEAERLYATVFEEDDEAYEMFQEVCGLPESRVIRCGEKDNFWAMGDTGPCGPCAEFHYDRGPEHGGDELLDPESEGDRLVEIWNHVFMQYDRDASGKLTPLPSPCIDTGMGLERIAMVANGLDSVHETDLLRPLAEHMAGIAGIRYGDDPTKDVSLRVIADHARCCSFLISDGVLPSNEWRGYVLRRIMRRALRHGRLLGVEDTFFDAMATAVIDRFQGHFRELSDNSAHILNVIRNEERRFSATLKQGMSILSDYLGEAKDKGETILAGDRAFFLYDTYGFPMDLTREIVRDAGMTVDEDGYAKAMEEQTSRARQAHQAGTVKGADPVYHELLKEHGPTEFLGYTHDEAVAQVLAVVVDGKRLEAAPTGTEVELFLDRTPFYAESGGQVGDTGEIAFEGGSATVTDCKKVLPELWLHRAKVTSGALAPGAQVKAVVDTGRLQSVSRNHTATHLLQWALQESIGDHVRQAGSYVGPDRLRFDFTHFASLGPDDVRRIEDLINGKIAEDDAVTAQTMPIDEALKSGAMALFGEKYGDVVRVVDVGGYSRELCGGIHVGRAGEIGSFLVTREEAVASGVRRIEAVTGSGAYALAKESREILQQLSGVLNTAPQAFPDRVRQLQQQVKTLEKEIHTLKSKLATAGAKDPMSEVREVAGVKYIALRVDGMEMSHLRNLADELKGKLKSGVVVLGAENKGSVNLVAGVTKDLTGKLKAGAIIKEVAAICGGGGGGRPDMAQAGGKDPAKLDEALALVPKLLETK